MSETFDSSYAAEHEHVFLGVGHEQNERKTWAVIVLCAVMMVVEIVGGSIFGSLALVADGLHMSTHVSARVGPGHFAAVASIVSRVSQRGPAFYHDALRRLNGLSHITVEVHTQPRSE